MALVLVGRIEHEPAPFQRDARGRKLLGGEARADDAGPQRAPGEFGGQWQHADREGDLRDHQRGPRGAEPHAGPSGERAGAQPRQAPRGLERRHEAGHGGPSQGQAGDEEKRAVRHAESHPERRAAGDVLQAPGHHDRHDAQDQQGDTGGRGRQHERLDEQLPDDPRAAAAEGVARGELLLPRDGARVVQDRDVRARRQQQQDEREARQRPQQAQLAAFEVPREGKRVRHHARSVASRSAGRPSSALRATEGRREDPERRHLSVRARERRARREPAEDDAFGTGVAQHLVVRGPEPERNPGTGS